MSNILLFIFLLLIPTQLGRHFWFEWSTIQGIRSDYLSPIWYLVDMVWLLWIWSKLRLSHLGYLYDLRNLSWVIKIIMVLVVVLVVGINIWLAGNPWIAVYRWMRVGQWILSVKLLKSESYKVKEYLKIIIPVWILVEGYLAIAQVASNGSLQGIWWWFGERKFDYMTLGVAMMSWFDEARIRAYGTFSHPNSLAGFTIVAWMIWEKLTNLRQNTKTWIIRILAVVTIIIAGSRTVWVMTAMLLIFNFQFSIFKKNLNTERYLITGLVIFVGILIFINSSGWDSESWSKRMKLNEAAMEMAKTNLLVGVGAGNFVVNIPNFDDSGIRWLQPVHNILLLGLSEVGVLGCGLMVWIMIKIKLLKSTKEDWGWVVLVVILTGMADHYWLTLPQNMWLLAVVMAII